MHYRASPCIRRGFGRVLVYRLLVTNARARGEWGAFTLWCIGRTIS